MIVLVLGLTLFLGIHVVPMLPRLRAAPIARLGADRWRGIHATVAAVGLGLVIWGFARARGEGVAPFWDVGVRMRHLALLLLMPVFPLLVEVGRPGRLAATVGHPMVTAVILWAAAHLLIVASAPAQLLMSAFLGWSIAARLSLARRKPTLDPKPPFGANDAIAVVVGLILWAAMVWKAHLWLIGVAPLP
mgnify:CR=1 FL=1